MRELYKRGSRLGTTASAVGVELKAMAKAGLVILKHDAVYCGVQESTASGGTSAATDSGGSSKARNRIRRRPRSQAQTTWTKRRPGQRCGGCWLNSSTSARTRDAEPPLTKATDPVTDIDRRDHSGAEGARRRRVHNVSGRGGSSGWTRGTQDLMTTCETIRGGRKRPSHDDERLYIRGRERQQQVSTGRERRGRTGEGSGDDIKRKGLSRLEGSHLTPGEPVRRTYEGCNKPRPRRGARDSVLGTCWIAVQPIGQRRSAGRVKLEGQNWSFDVVYEVNTGF
eukprot:scaffold103121_cov65-Phaeocystis_antarctica.AAC.7